MPASPHPAAQPHDPVDAPAPRPAPASLRDLFWSFTWLALQGFGGVLAVVQRELVEKKRWLTNEEFVEDWAVAQIMPGPNVVNLSITIGERYFGWRGAVVAVCGMLCFPMLLVLTLTMIYSQLADHPAVAGALRGMGAVAAGLVAGMGLKLTSTLARHPLGRWCSAALALASFIAMAVLRVPLAWTLLVVGGAGCVLTWRKLSP
ncbi:chromate transporter, chromate ion transporter (CHR) family [Delftia tsuruhatensis]|uniref:chromate transporter n=1 Tax=Delftia tsuruhatensis TaxID=180282 RepID=UPI001E6A5EC9|nr:chromate transporter [Delftia tsuruhatensis]CAB5672533.1 chromate transporter, chromate ion transporter (CHR) family [Delftia tsuruhatensis]CAC9683452.1 chromate transporter, chromate ion transporter (CHR) family [Delftia tsuruhatensis]